jgi:site-specific DNA-methyltransferase (adenine-specific)
MRTGQNYTKGTIPTCVWEKNNHTTSKDYCGWHATTKNIEVLERIIRAYSNENDLVLDCFMGSGSTAIACKLSNRDYIGSELDQDYLKKARARIKSYDRINTLSSIL